MIRSNQDAALAKIGNPFTNRANDVSVDVFQSTYFGYHIAVVGRFIRRLDVHVYQVAPIQGFQRVSSFAGIVRIDVTGYTRHLDNFQACG